MAKPEDRPKFGPERSQNRSRKPRLDAMAAAGFYVPAAAPDLEGGFYVVEATAKRDLLNPGAPAPAEPTDPAVDPTSGDPAAPATEQQQATLYRWNSRQDSTLKGPRRSELWDVVTNYRDGDEIDAPEGITTTEITESSGSIRKLNAGLINAKGVGGEAFAANTARAFLYTGPNKDLQDGVFVVFNDNNPGYQHRKDGLIFLKGFSFEREAVAGTVEPESAGATRTILFWQPSTVSPPQSEDTAGI